MWLRPARELLTLRIRIGLAGRRHHPKLPSVMAEALIPVTTAILENERPTDKLVSTWNCSLNLTSKQSSAQRNRAQTLASRDYGDIGSESHEI